MVSADDRRHDIAKGALGSRVDLSLVVLQADSEARAARTLALCGG